MYRTLSQAEDLAREQVKREIGDIELPRFLEYENFVIFDKYGNTHNKWEKGYKYRYILHKDLSQKWGYAIKGVIWKNTDIILKINTIEFYRKINKILV